MSSSTGGVADAYGIFIDSGSPDSYLTGSGGGGVGGGGGSGTNDTSAASSYLNGTFNLNSTRSLNGTGGAHTDEDVTELIIMAVTSVLLGLMILITVIGKDSIRLSEKKTRS